RHVGQGHGLGTARLTVCDHLERHGKGHADDSSNTVQLSIVMAEETMVPQHLLYGLRPCLPAQVAAALGARLGLDFERRESHYVGEYWLAKSESATIKIVEQPDAYGDFTEKGFSEYLTLIYVDGDGSSLDLGDIRVGDATLEKLRVRETPS